MFWIIIFAVFNKLLMGIGWILFKFIMVKV